MPLNRRKLLRYGAGAAAAGVAGGAGWLATGPSVPEPGIADALATLNRIDAANRVVSTGAWSATKVMHHLAQSVEMSLGGYPSHKSALFQNTLGSTAFAVFRKRGHMSHALDEAIPGAPRLDADGDLGEAVSRLRRAIEKFAQHDGELAAHFAYGQLSKEQYAVAHALHLDDHMREISLS